MEHSGQTIRNTPYTTVRITVLVVYRLYATSAGDIIFRSGHFHRTTIRQRARHLHQTFSESTVTYNHRPVVILQSTCKNFRGRSRTAIHQHSNRYVQIQRLAQRLIRIAGLLNLPLRRYNHLATGQEEISYLHSFFQQPTAIVTQVNYQRGDALFLQIKESLFEFLGRVAGESAQADITHIIIQLAIIRNERQLDAFTDNRKVQWFFFAGTLHLQLKARAYLTAQHLTHIRIPRQVFPVYLKQDITGFQSHFRSRHILVRFHNHRTFQLRLIANDGTYTSIRAFQHLLQFAAVFFRIIFRVRVQ